MISSCFELRGLCLYFCVGINAEHTNSGTFFARYLMLVFPFRNYEIKSDVLIRVHTHACPGCIRATEYVGQRTVINELTAVSCLCKGRHK